MNELASFILPVKNFNDTAATFKIEIFGWYLHCARNKERFTATDVGQCFDVLHLKRPSNIHQLLKNLCDRKPSRLLKDQKGYRASAAAREDFQRLLPVRDSILATTVLLSTLAERVTDPAQKTFLAETLICYGNGAYRAAIVMAWNLAFSHLCDFIFKNDLAKFNTHLLKVLPKESGISKRTDFEAYKESRILEIAKGAGIISVSSNKVLKEKLDKRNTAAHPSSIKVTSVTAEEVIHDLVENILLKTEL